jgi:hypothetical protein
MPLPRLLLICATFACVAACSGGGGNAPADNAPAPSPGVPQTTPPSPPPAEPPSPPPAGDTRTGFPLLFVTSVPGTGFRHQLNTFANHGTGIADAVPGGDLWLRDPDGTLRNLTQEAGWGVASGGLQGGAKAIAVRQPSMHWNGDKALFSMLVGGPVSRYDNPSRTWQMYEVTGLKKGEKAVITKVAQQPAYNNISPIYGSDDQVLFVSDAPLFGMKHTWPQLDEYENTPTNTGIWKLNPATGKLAMIEHSPSGVFDLYLDSFGRVLFTKWDHLKRDQQADIDRYDGGGYGPFDVADESPGAKPVASPPFDANGRRIADAKGVLYDIFPEARRKEDPTRKPNESLHDFNQFFVWQVNEDGSEEETLNHVGRQEFGGTYMEGIFTDDPNLSALFPSFGANAAMRQSFRADSGLFQLREDPAQPGRYVGIYAQEFGRQAAGRLVEFSMPPGTNPETVAITDHTNATLDDDPNGEKPRKPTMTGHFRNPLKLGDGRFIASHTDEYRLNKDESTDPTRPQPRYVFQLKALVKNPAGSDLVAGASLTGGLVKDVQWWDGDARPRRYLGPLNETDVVEVRPRPRPATLAMKTSPVEKQVIAEAGVDEAALRGWLVARNMAIIVSRNVTLRDRADVSQPFNLSVPGGTKNVPHGGRVYDVDRFQILQGDLTRGYGAGRGEPSPGRRVYVKPLHNSAQHPLFDTVLPPIAGAPAGTVKLAADGSLAAIVPAGRALTWQLMSPANEPVVRERVWVSFAPGEIRTCASCHGINSQTHNGLGEPQNPPQALRDLLQAWKKVAADNK